MDRPRILLWDIETAPMVVTSWGLHEIHLSHDHIMQESSIICAAWKWLGEKEIYTAQINPSRPSNDLPVLRQLHRALREADVLVGHNGDRFDLRKYNARAIYHRLDPLPPIPTIDTLKIARRVFGFNSNRLDYLGKFLLGRGKIHTDYDLWIQVMDGNEKALEKMVKYNVGDVALLEDIYLVLRPYIKNHPNAALYKEEICCPNCGSEELTRRGFLYQRTTQRQRYQCRGCGAWSSGKFVAKAEVK